MASGGCGGGLWLERWGLWALGLQGPLVHADALSSLESPASKMLSAPQPAIHPPSSILYPPDTASRRKGRPRVGTRTRSRRRFRLAQGTGTGTGPRFRGLAGPV
ncbi:hypothetical protein K439DRAFT_1621722 [Ramaria rubella]|nr:hypothetical protein K439DRAFT_1621722 [Ramaria rubella]